MVARQTDDSRGIADVVLDRLRCLVENVVIGGYLVEMVPEHDVWLLTDAAEENWKQCGLVLRAWEHHCVIS